MTPPPSAPSDPSITSPSGLAGLGGLSLAALLAACGGGTPGAALERIDLSQARDMPQLLPVPAPLAQADGVRETRRAVPLPTPTQFMDWAETVFPGYFPPHQSDALYTGPDSTYAGLVFRAYPANGNYLLVWNSLCFVMGPLAGGGIAYVGNLSTFAEAVASTPSTAVLVDDKAAARFLLHAQFSASEADIAAVRQQGHGAWLETQFNRLPGQSGWDWLVSKGYSAIDIHEYFFKDDPAFYMVWNQLITAPDPVRKRWALALSELFVVATNGVTGLNWPGFAMAGYWDILCQEGFGNFRSLLEKITLCPAMGAFLNTLDNQKEDPATGRLPDENYAREVMQLFTIGLYQLNQDGTPKLGANGQPIETYTQSDVTNLARVFTGYTLNRSAGNKFPSPKPPNPLVNNLAYIAGPMVLDAARHSTLEVNFLGIHIAAGTPANEALRIALDGLFNHPNVGPFFARQMIQRLVTGNPSPAYVARVAGVFNSSGAGVRGDLRSVLRAILLDPDAMGASGLADPSFGKLREPMVRVVQWARSFKATSRAGTWKIRLWEADPRGYIGQQPLNPGSVFNFFRPGYVPPGTAMALTGATAPEFQAVNDSSVGAYINYLNSILWNGMWVVAPELPYFPDFSPTPTDGFDIVPDYTAELALVLNDTALVQRLNLLLCAGQLSAETQNLIVNALAIDKVNASWSDAGKRAHVVRALLFVMCSADYLVQK